MHVLVDIRLVPVHDLLDRHGLRLILRIQRAVPPPSFIDPAAAAGEKLGNVNQLSVIALRFAGRHDEDNLPPPDLFCQRVVADEPLDQLQQAGRRYPLNAAVRRSKKGHLLVFVGNVSIADATK